MDFLYLRGDSGSNYPTPPPVCWFRGRLSVLSGSYPTLWDPLNCSPPGSCVHGDSPGKNTGVGCHALLQEIFPTRGSNPGLRHCRQILYRLGLQGFGRDHPILQNTYTVVVRMNGMHPCSKISFFFFLSHKAACRILVPGPPAPPAAAALLVKHLTPGNSLNFLLNIILHMR